MANILPPELLTRVFENTWPCDNHTSTVHSCLLFNEEWYVVAIQLLYKDLVFFVGPQLDLFMACHDRWVVPARTRSLTFYSTMIEPITVRLTSWQASIATITLVVAMCNLAWTIFSKVEDWKIAKADKKEKEQAEARNNMSTAEKLVSFEERIAELEKKLEKKLETAINDNTKAHEQRKESILSLVEQQGRMSAHLKALEKSQCKCDLTKSNEVHGLATKIISELDAATKQLSAIKPCRCRSEIPHPVLSMGNSRQSIRLSPTKDTKSSRSLRGHTAQDTLSGKTSSG
ncbi:hypothetical protein H9Q74_009838 [Fusarium xylarioides]|nr:hypothetical protein H9Q71_009335 [Fusarium xylarioides]KAG5818827.1 hypothetical protein H9Q74_009838 [Fusarium xylarioides]